MSNSISGTVAPLPVPFSLNLIATRSHERDNAAARRDERAKQITAKRKAQHEVELLAIGYARIMLEQHINAALDPATDPALAAKLRNDIMNRGVGKVRDVEDDEDAKKAKGSGALEFLEALAAISVAASAIERTPSAPRIERDISVVSDDDFEKLMDDIDDEVCDE